jgi:type III restriction enzyme
MSADRSSLLSKNLKKLKPYTLQGKNMNVDIKIALDNRTNSNATLKGIVREFQYDKQPYQETCINNIVGFFAKINQKTPFKEIVLSHLAAFKYPCQISDKKNIDILMETGTGKTFTFIKTIFELSNKFGHKKFIILAPSVAIREGTKASFADTKHYFKSYYANKKDKEIELFVYESGQISQVERFINDANKLSCLLMTPASFNDKNNKLNQPLEKDYFRTADNYLELLKLLNPIIIIDEPHKFEGKAFKKYFEGFNNYYLRFGATFPTAAKNGNAQLALSNVCYMLDSVSSFRQSLVKQITVHTQDITSARQTIVKIEDKVCKVNNFENGHFTKPSDLRVGNSFNGILITKINKANIVLQDGQIITPNFALTPDALRMMIAHAIKIHFAKEAELFLKGIKALSLFFIDHITRFRDEQNPIVKQIFEQEYIEKRLAKIEELKDKPEYKEYLKYLENDFDTEGKLAVHKGYFSGDKGSKDEKIKQGVEEILKDKKKLLSFESPTRFIFSIWALQEGWDNPNVFTICKLARNGSETSKLQQIGRGLRCCVNQKLQRQSISLFNDNQEEFWRVNNLDVIVSNQEAGFASAIQNEILKNSYLLNDTFTLRDIRKTLKEKTHFADDIVNHITNFMKDKKLIVYKKMDEQYDEVFEKSQFWVKEIQAFKDNAANIPSPLVQEHINAIEALFATDINNYVKAANSTKKKKSIRIKDKHLADFKALWEKINQNSLYFIDPLTDEDETKLIQKIAKQTNAINIQKIFLQTKKSIIDARRLANDNSAITQEQSAPPREYECKVDYLKLVLELASKTHTPVSFIAKIINALSKDFKQNMLKNDIAQAQKEMEAIISNHLIGDIKANIDYSGIDGQISNAGAMYDAQGNFKQVLPAGSLGKTQEDLPPNFNLKEEWIFEDILEYDSDFEKEIILKDHKIDNIKIFGKMPKLEINTPLGKYNPDFCYAIEGKGGKKVFLIVESKGYQTEQQVSQDERDKMEFAEKFFEKVNEKFKAQGIKIMYEKRINRTQLTSLIQKAIGE